MNLKSINKDNLRRAALYVKRNGVKSCFYRALEGVLEKSEYEASTNSVFDEIEKKERFELEASKKFTHNYKISIVVPVYEPEKEYFIKMAESVLMQSYSGYELCIADASKSDVIEEAVSELRNIYSEKASADKLKYKRIKDNKGISENTNEALALATGEYVAFLDHDDVLTDNALYEVMEVLEKGIVSQGNSYTNSIKMIYSDEDKCNSQMTEFFDPNIKPDFNIDLLRSNNYICHFLVVRRSLAQEVNGFNSEFDGAQDFDFILKCSEKLKNSEIKHINKILYHWRCHESSTAANPESKRYAYEAGKRAVFEHLKRSGIEAVVEDTEHVGFYRVKYKVDASQLTDVKILNFDEYSSMSNDELDSLEESYIMILNDNIKPENYEFVEEMLGHLLREDVGCVGGLVIKGGKIESAGYSFDESGSLTANFSGLNKHFSGYLHRAKLQRVTDGVCTDCMMIKKSALNENKELKAEYKVIYTPYAVFYRK